MALLLKEQMQAGQFATARQTFTDLLDLIDSKSDSVVSSPAHKKSKIRNNSS